MLGTGLREAYVALAIALGLCHFASAAFAADQYRTTIDEAVKLLPLRPVQVAVIDADEAKPDVRKTLLELDAFVLRGSRVVYLTKHSEVLQGAHRGSTLYTCMLASIIWHEMAHAEGADESVARRREAALWTQFLIDGKVDPVTALRYLEVLMKRHGP